MAKECHPPCQWILQRGVMVKAIDERKQWNNLIRKSKRNYAHFDVRTDLGCSKTADYVKDPAKVTKHGFYPFIHYKLEYHRYSTSEKKNSKVRDVCYAAHIDKCIYQYYSYLLNEAYLERIKSDGIYNVPIAYRTDLHMNNIHFAKIAFNFIHAKSPCSIMIGDFKGFFDNLDHEYLKKQWCTLLGVDNLPSDHYAVYKSITKYSVCERKDLLRINGLNDTLSGVQTLNKKKRVLSVDGYHEFKKIINYDRNGDSHKFITLNQHKDEQGNVCGIPQGSPISASLANIYMLEIDKYIYEYVKSYNGLYMRYCDDFIVIIPDKDMKYVSKNIFNTIIEYLNLQPGITLEPKKTQYFVCYDSTIVNLSKMNNSNNCKHFLNFLGFSYDGTKVTLRSKTIFKYYSRMYKKIKTITNNHGISPYGKHISCNNLYNRYSIRGVDDRSNSKTNFSKRECSLNLKEKRGNFVSYVIRAKSILGDEFDEKVTTRHMSKIRKALKR